MEFQYPLFTRVPGESYRWRFRSLLLCPLSVERYYFPLFVVRPDDQPPVPVRVGSPSRGGDVTTGTNRACPLFFYSVLVSVSVFMALSTVFHSINSPDNSPFSHSVLVVKTLLVLSTTYLFMKVSFCLDIIPSG